MTGPPLGPQLSVGLQTEQTCAAKDIYPERKASELSSEIFVNFHHVRHAPVLLCDALRLGHTRKQLHEAPAQSVPDHQGRKEEVHEELQTQEDRANTIR